MTLLAGVRPMIQSPVATEMEPSATPSQLTYQGWSKRSLLKNSGPNTKSPPTTRKNDENNQIQPGVSLMTNRSGVSLIIKLGPASPVHSWLSGEG